MFILGDGLSTEGQPFSFQKEFPLGKFSNTEIQELRSKLWEEVNIKIEGVNSFDDLAMFYGYENRDDLEKKVCVNISV